MKLIDKIFSFIVGLAVILGGLVCVAWFIGSLVVYCLLNRPMWEEAILQGYAAFRFLREKRRARLSIDFKHRRLRVREISQ